MTFACLANLIVVSISHDQLPAIFALQLFSPRLDRYCREVYHARNKPA